MDEIENAERKKDAKTVLKMIKEVTKAKPKMWGDSIVGFGEYEYTRSNGDFGTFMMTGFSPRKTNLTLYHAGIQIPRNERYSKKTRATQTWCIVPLY